VTKDSILFVSPDYHSAFALRAEFRKIGWKANIYVPPGFPERFLFETVDVIRGKNYANSKFIRRAIVAVFNFVHFFWISRNYKYHVHYGALLHPQSIEPYLLRMGLGSNGFHLGLSILRSLGKKIIYLPSGCRDEELRSQFELLDDGAVCGNCGFSDQCSDGNILPNLKRAMRYAHLSVGLGFLETSYLKVEHLRYKSIDLDRWKPVEITPASSLRKIRVLHSHALETRNTKDRNIKGSPIIIELMRKIERELPNVEFVEVTGLTTREMLEEQQKADIIVDQLHYGHWGSSGVEALALGKVLVCYLRPEWSKNFLGSFPDVKHIPIIQADIHNFYDVMMDLLQQPEKIAILKKESRAFAEIHYQPQSNVQELVRVFKGLDAVN
jgi:hypothetical protein